VNGNVAYASGHLLCFREGSLFAREFDTATRAIRDLDRRAEGRITLDGKWVAYTDVPAVVLVRPFDAAGAKVPVSIRGGSQSRWDRDGKRLFDVAPDR